MADDSDDKTEEPTADRQRKAREEGQFPRAKDATSLAGSFFVMGGLYLLGPSLVSVVTDYATRCFSEPFLLVHGAERTMGQELIGKIIIVSLPLVILSMVGGVAMGIVEAGFEPNLDLAQPKWERLNPIPKLQSMVSPQQAGVQTAMSLARITVVGLVAWSIIKSEFPKLVRLSTAPLDAGVLEVLGVVTRVALWSSLALAILAGADYGYNWWKHFQNIKMSKQELKEEHHAQEGDPYIKAKRRARAREIVKKGVAKELKRSDVVVTNPTHVAVALRYRPEEGVPVVTTKGYDDVAQYIKRLAKEQGIPCVENVPLARALAANVKAGRPIPIDMFAAVAEVLAFVFRLKRRGLRA